MTRTDTMLRAGFAAAALLAVVAGLAHLGPQSVRSLHAAYLAAALTACAASALLADWLGRRAGVRQALPFGVAAGALWILEIGFNNLTDHSLSTGQARFLVDNGVWAMTIAFIAAASARAAMQLRSARAAVAAGAFAGLVSGLLACLAGLSLVAFGADVLARDPLEIAEWSARGRDLDLVTYVAWETFAGAVGHLTVLGVVEGALLGGLVAASMLAARALARPTAAS